MRYMVHVLYFKTLMSSTYGIILLGYMNAQYITLLLLLKMTSLRNLMICVDLFCLTTIA